MHLQCLPITNPQDMTPPRNIIPDCDFLVIGCGATGTSIMAQLAKTRPERTFKVVFVEKSDTFGPGFPYSDQIVLPEHLVNIACACIDITKTDMRYSDLSDFLKWADSLDEYQRTLHGLTKT